MGLLRARLRTVAVELDLAPNVALDPHSQKLVQRSVEDRGVEITYAQRETERIEFGRRQPNAREALIIRVSPQKLSIEVSFPRITLPPIVKELDEISRSVLGALNPLIIASIRVVVRKQVAAPGGDAREFLGENILHLTDARRRTLSRPIHTVGLKVFMPPCQVGGDDDPEHVTHEDAVEVRIESLIEDPSDIFIECRQTFAEPRPPASLATLGEFLTQTDAFINERISAFLGMSDAEEGAGDV